MLIFAANNPVPIQNRYPGNSQDKIWEKSLSFNKTGILWRKGFEITIRGIKVRWIKKTMFESWQMASSLSNLHIFKMSAKLKKKSKKSKNIYPRI